MAAVLPCRPIATAKNGDERSTTTPASASRSANAGVARLPGEGRADRVGIARRARVAGEQLEQRGQLRAAAHGRQDERRRAAAGAGARRGWTCRGGGRAATRCAERRRCRGARAPRRARRSTRSRRKSVSRYRSPAIRGESRMGGCSRAAVPTAAGRSTGRLGLLKLTFGTCLASGGASKNGYSLKPNIFAVRFAGNCRRAVLYSCTRSL